MTISDEKIQELVNLFHEKIDGSVTAEKIEYEIRDEYNRNIDDFQNWLDYAEDGEVVDWLATFLP